jgi:peroxiredoxin
VKNKWLITVFTLIFLSTIAVSCSQTGQTLNPGPNSPNSNDSSKNKPFGEQSTAKLVVGSLAPNFGLKDLNGKLVVLSNFRGKKVIVNMWDLQCHGCAEEIRFIEDYSKRLTDPGIVFLTVNVYQPADIVSLYMQGNKFTFPVLVDPNKVMPKSYVDAGTPTTYFIDKDGIIQQIKDGMFESTKEIIDTANSY